ncbi:hypoxanthine phosphoribosyltransferase [Candidatus Oleimmundimicrobium sp.]|uniref:hypoxanthine phosphoribosyltransferase n=1 Tax=Candidatus Oleimmundimicrobium sp. TaxID=3060597 RepID=UPI002716852C|nr:hypoxanthine phosphoribosyltransferase [Candidatus Oleimmundimicrobium sp.]MDO8885914.1 hypoxanthine phosphoribosyltransferase [Candidatus Oleimmundimicrobium sp.]
MDEDLERILIGEKEIKKRVKELGESISKDYQGKELVLVGILRGAIIFLADLAREINVPMKVDFMAVSSYGSSTKTSGVVRILKDLDDDIRGKDVLIVEDIVDTGLTLKYLLKNLKSRKPASLKVCSLLKKENKQQISLDIDYCGFKVPDNFIVGYGLDWDEKYRNLSCIYVLKPELYNED